MSQSIIVFTRYPQAGKAKTRLIPTVGAEGAAEFQRQMTKHAVGRAWSYSTCRPNTRLIVAFEGGTLHEMRSWLGPLDYRAQGEGDLGDRLSRMVDRELQRGIKKVVVMGSDCPAINEDILEQAFAALDTAPIVFGPAQDGGYYLIGMTHSSPQLFQKIPWGTSRVLAESLLRIRDLGLTSHSLPTLADVDEISDLESARHELRRGRSLSVIIPALNEASGLVHLIPRLQAESPLEIIVADGGSTDSTVEVAASLGAKVLTSQRGRGRQMNAAANIARGELLLFLHADTEPPDHYPEVISSTLSKVGTSAGSFGFKLREAVSFQNCIERLVHLRCAYFQAPYGDQCLFLRKYLFNRIGGYPDWPILEDVELVRRLKTFGSIQTVPQKCATSSRRWISEGTVRTFMRHQMILLGYRLGLPVDRLAKLR